MRRRDFTAAELDQLDRDVAELAWRWARRLIDLTAEQSPHGPVDPGVRDEDRADAHLARLYVLTRLRQSADARSDADVFYSQQTGATYEDVAAAMDIR